VLSYITDPRIPEREGRELRARVERLEGEERKTFLEKLSEAVDERLMVLETSAIDRNLLRKRLELFLQLREKGGALNGAPGVKEETFAMRLQREFEEHPVRTTLTGAVVVLGALTVASWIANRFRKAHEAGKQAMQTGGSWIKRILIATGVSLGVFLGERREGHRRYKTSDAGARCGTDFQEDVLPFHFKGLA